MNETAGPLQSVCPSCNRSLPIADAAFCPFCGKPLSDKTSIVGLPQTPVDAEAPTLPAVPGTTQQAGFQSAPPTKVGNFQLLRALGRGGMGTVYEAEDCQTGRHVALKLIAPEFAASPTTAERFRQEGRLASAINHPRCVFVHAAETQGDQPFIVMELMPGDTLRDLVERQGPLPVRDAIAKILDVIDGLMEAHRLDVIHRDVKPSNCFLDAQGRVKIGDFGLAKSLVKKGSSHLTRSGTFIGTPYFASPEQVRGEPLDAQTDVYSVAATLYYLLTGRPPFAGSDPASTLAKIVSEDPVPMRKLRPDIPAALDRIVLKGLQRDRRRRYQSLAEMRDDLVRLLAAEARLRTVGFRFAAGVIDLLALQLVVVGLEILGVLVWSLSGVNVADAWKAVEPVSELLLLILYLSYFWLTESYWQASVGKLLLSLRVTNADAEGPASPLAILLRTVAFVFIIEAGSLIVLALDAARFVGWMPALEAERPWYENLFPLLGYVGGGLVLASTMRRDNGYRGLHELVSGTRVVQLPWLKRRPAPISTLGWFLYLKRTRQLLGEGSSQLDDFPSTIGGFSIRGGVRLSPTTTLLLGEDSSLDRKVAILVRPEDAPPLEPKRREISRTTRPRWVASGTIPKRRWDAFLAPQGCPLPDLIASEGRLPWSEVRSILQQLSDELLESLHDGTFPQPLRLDHVWISRDGRVQIADWPAADVASPWVIPDDRPPERQALELLRRVAVLTLEGKPRDDSAPPSPIQAPLPEHGRRILDRLLGVQEPTYHSLEEIHDDLLRTQDAPSEVDATLRMGQLAILASGVIPSLVLMFGFGLGIISVAEEGDPYPRIALLTILATLIIVAGWIVWSMIFRGGLSFGMMGLALVDSRGRPASVWRCGLRSLIVWGPIVLVLLLSLWMPMLMDPERPHGWLEKSWITGWGIVVALLLVYGALTLNYPSRSVHDYLAGTYVVPE
ncbi:MAG: protein kinase [Gemmatales bacterium]|nr:protein kinase [Gemmatales bacterium]MDW8387226.1 protein kinase [Gemmatales bacterium]